MEFRDAGTRCLWRIGILELSRHLFGKKGRFVLEFHGIFSHRSSKLPADAQPGLSAEELSTILKWVGGRFRFLTPEEFLKGSAPGVLLTFDDGLASTFKCGVPILERYKAPAIFLCPRSMSLNPLIGCPPTANWLISTGRKANLMSIPMNFSMAWMKNN